MSEAIDLLKGIQDRLDQILKELQQQTPKRGATRHATAEGDARVDAQTKNSVSSRSLENARSLQRLWNEKAAPGLPRWEGMNRQRIAASNRVLSTHTLHDMEKVIQKINASDHCTGLNDRGWRAGPDFFLREQSIHRTLEGLYDNKKTHADKPTNDFTGWTRIADRKRGQP